MRIGTLLLAAALAAACLTGCDAQTPPETAEGAGNANLSPDEYLYPVDFYFDDWMRATHWTFDSEGNIIPEERQFRVLVDVLTGEPQCKTLRRTEAVGKDENDRIITREMTALFDMDGNLLYDWEEGTYQEAFGDFIVRQNMMIDMREMELPEGFVTELWNYKTGESVIPNVAEVMRLSEHEALLGDFVFAPQGIVDDKANKLAGFPAPAEYLYARVWQDKLIASDTRHFADAEEGVRPRYFLLTKAFEPLYENEYVFEGESNNILRFAFTDEEGREIVGLLTGEGREIYTYTPDEYPLYHDDQLTVIQSGEYDSPTNPERYRLVRYTDGAVLAEDCEIMYTESESDPLTGESKPSETFLAYKNDTILILDREGKTVASREMPGVRYLETFGPGIIRVSVRNERDENRDAILDGALRDIITAGRYNNVLPGGGDTVAGEYVQQDLLLGERFLGEANTRLVDVMDLEGNLLVGDLNEVFCTGPNRLAVRRGFDVGLMDWDGNWIMKRSIFTEALHD